MISAKPISLPSIFVPQTTSPGVVHTRIELPDVPLPQHSLSQLGAANGRGEKKKASERSGWLGYMAENFESGHFSGERDWDRTKEALEKMSLAELRSFKRALVAGHPREWELLRHPVLKDTIEGDRKHGQIQKIRDLLEGGVFQEMPDHRVEIATAELRLRGAEERASKAKLTLSDLNVLSGILEYAGRELPKVEAKCNDDAAGARALLKIKARFERIAVAIAPLEASVEKEMQVLRARIKIGSWGLQDLLQIRPDDRDAYVTRLLRCYRGESSYTEGDNLGYAGSPVQAILDAIDGAKLGKNDVFFDMGAGLGKVVLLTAILTGCQARAVEYHPGSCAHLRRISTELGLSDRVQVIEGDAAKADLSSGTAFYFFNPFRGAVMTAVSEQILRASQHHPIRIASFGDTELSAFRDWQRLDTNGPCKILRPHGE